MDIPWIRGKVALQAHVEIPAGAVEEEYARNGFFGRYAHLYRTEPPVGWSRIQGPLQPRAFDLSGIAAAAPGDWLAARTRLLENGDVRLSMARLDAPMPYAFRNADGDEVLFVHGGAGRLESDFGGLDYREGDYLVIPRGCAYRLVPSTSTRMLCVEAFSEVSVPDRGILGQHALFDPAVLKVPSPDQPSTMRPGAGEDYELRIQRDGALTSVFYPFRPLNTVGWKGTLSVLQLNIEDIRPVTSERYHLPPSAHSTFVMQNAVICTFLPRPLETGDPKAMKVPFFHSNIDFDEVLFYHRGQFFSRAGIGPGMLTFHPQGIHHGPQPGAVDRAGPLARTEEVAVMLDTRRPLRVAPPAEAFALPDYVNSWKQPKGT